jgi:3-oxoacyl-(acyl-carrier-protein) synthase
MTPDAPPATEETSSANAVPAARVVIAGLGLITPLGHSAWTTFNALRHGRTLADRAARLPEPIEALPLVRALGAVSVAQHVSRDPTVELAERAGREAALAASVSTTNLPLWLGTSKGAVGALVEAAELVRHQRFKNPEAVGSDAWLAGALGPHQYLATQLARRLNASPRTHHVAACASSLTALHHAANNLRQRAVDGCTKANGDDSANSNQPSDMALVATADAALLPMLVHSYRRLGVLAELTAEGYRQRPLDARRQGFMLSEAGAAVVLKRLPPGQAPEPGDVELLDTAIASDAYDLVRPAPQMPALQYVANQLLANRRIDMIHPHAPGTAEHDPNELAIYRNALAQNNSTHTQADADQSEASDRSGPDLYACKGALGHSLGAAGLTSLVLACLLLKLGQRPPMPWLDEPIDADADGLRPDAAAQTIARQGTHAIFAAGFAGHTAGAVIQRH